MKTKETVKIRYRLQVHPNQPFPKKIGGNFLIRLPSQSFISHRGTQASVGHYVCTVKNEENCGPHGSSSFYRSGQDANPPNFLDWTCFDDSRVNQVFIFAHSCSLVPFFSFCSFFCFFSSRQTLLLGEKIKRMPIFCATSETPSHLKEENKYQ